MANPFASVILRLRDLGFFSFFLPFILSAAIFYGLLRKSQIFGEGKQNITVNAIVALVAAFMVWAYPIIAGVDIETQMATFFTLAMIATLPVIVALLLIGFVVPANLPNFFKDNLKGKPLFALIIVFILIGFGILVSSGLFSLFIPAGFGDGFGFSLDNDTILTIVVVIIMVISAVFVVFATGRGEGSGK
jgi:hypothetical protein